MTKKGSCDCMYISVVFLRLSEQVGVNKITVFFVKCQTSSSVLLGIGIVCTAIERMMRTGGLFRVIFSGLWIQPSVLECNILRCCTVSKIIRDQCSS